MTNINLERKDAETEQDDGTHIKCRFLDSEGACGIHPDRPSVCYLYPFSTSKYCVQGFGQASTLNLSRKFGSVHPKIVRVPELFL